ncbi:SDR family oxidoreductase [Cereibacter sphaeroides]|uniref:SDR family oxidoreductase n=1 Tax=Cereibacter sphaeroides TaxID=1063 RepID=UPI001F2B15AD|nr:SDR family oxidoreductase [Cereibacter sphaeroides]MCE6957631.1 SDR family oxidoreductase [Cereibacter sphaeroides]MCE6971098.1 SDR family oxidoreductase [Cereibacter sphaeroides]
MDVPQQANDLAFRLRRRAGIRRQIPGRRSVQEGKADRLADLLDEAADEIEGLRRPASPAGPGRGEPPAARDGCSYVDLPRQVTGERRALVLGAYGLIGSACLRALARAGFAVTGVGRSERSARASAPDASWIIRDVTRLTVGDWKELLEGVDVVVNASGALQDGGRDNLEAIHVTTVARLVEAARGRAVRIVQISAAGAAPGASTEFLRSKARGDAILAAEGGDWTILRPVLVFSPDAYGGTALLRGVAALPLVLPVVLPRARVQVIHVEDLAFAVVAAAKGDIRSGAILDLAASDVHAFPDLVARLRRWQGFPEPLVRPRLPEWVLPVLGSGADLLGRLGWRSPLRTTALRALGDGIEGEADAWARAGGPFPAGRSAWLPLDRILESLPSTRQERLFARLYFALPLAIGALALFWTLSGIVALADPERAGTVLGSSVPAWISATTVIGGGLADLGLGLAILRRRWARPAALGMMILSGLYVAGSLVLVPGLWLDPLGPMVKVLPGMVLAGFVAAMLEDR